MVMGMSATDGNGDLLAVSNVVWHCVGSVCVCVALLVVSSVCPR